MNRIEVPLCNGYKLVASQNIEPWEREIFIGIETQEGRWHQDLAIVRSFYHYEEESDDPVWEDDQFEVLVYGNPETEDWTESYTIGLVTEMEEEENGKQERATVLELDRLSARRSALKL